MNQIRTSAAAIAVLALMASMSAQASDGTITFNGQLNAATCTVAAASAALTVTLPTLSTAALASNGATAGKTAFSISLTGCSVGVTTAATYFEAGPTIDTTTGRLNNSGAAGNVQLRLSNADATSTVIDLSKSAGLQNSTAATVTAGAATANYYAEYYATGATTPGTVSSSVTYSMVYN